MSADPEATFEHDPLSEAVIGGVFRVANGLGTGFLEKVYENALMHELRTMSQRDVWPPKWLFTKKKKEIEPPMNTDEHRSKADKEKRTQNKIALVFIMSSSVFIGVHRWLKNHCFNLLNRLPSVAASLGACDAFVS